MEQIGKGGQGHVYLCRDMELGSLWAVKEISIFQKKEAWILRALEHPSFPKLVDYVEEQEKCYLIMEYIRGKNLQDWIHAGKKFSYSEILEIGISVAKVLEYLHGQSPSFYYGDLKPENLMRTEEGMVYLIDFGSVAQGHRIWQKRCMGTREYAAPEQREGIVNVRTDVYTFGKTMQKLCSSSFSCWKHPCLTAVLFKCSREKTAQRYTSMKVIEKRLQRLKRRNDTRKIRIAVSAGICLLAAALGISKWRLISERMAQQRFEQEFAAISEVYLETEFLTGSTETKEEIWKQTREKLQKLQKKYPDGQKQRRILQVLVIHAEIQGHTEEAQVYYEEILQIQPQWQEVYGDYGLFLLRNKETEKSQELWRAYCERKKKRDMEGGESHNLFVWEEKMQAQ